jgi:hypothetical protein
MLFAFGFCYCSVAHAQGAAQSPAQPDVPANAPPDVQTDVQHPSAPASSTPAPPPTTTVVSAPPVAGQPNAIPPCIQPAPLVSWHDYQGPMDKVVGAVGRKLERKSVHATNYKPGVLLCTFPLKDKFILVGEDLVDPITILGISFNAAISQAQNDDASFGQGAQGYGKRFGAAVADTVSGGLFKFILYPTIFSEDPRYYRLGEGSFGERFGHAVKHSVIAHRNNGSSMFNFSEWLGTTSVVVLSNVYHPGNQRGVGPAAERVAISISTDSGFDLLREFWPEVARKFKMPFRGENDPKN